VRRGDPGDLGVVVGGRDLDDVGADEVEPGERAQRGEQFPAGQPAGLRGAGAGRVRRVEHVDVDGQVDRPVFDAPGDLCSIMPVTPICSTSAAGITSKPISASSVRSASVYSGPRMPACRPPGRSPVVSYVSTLVS
jgi:hypothetical protein